MRKILKMVARQEFGKILELVIGGVCYNIDHKNRSKEYSKSNTIHDIDMCENLKGKHVSIKSTMSNIVSMGDISRVYDYKNKLLGKIDVVILKYKQSDNFRIITEIYEFTFDDKIWDWMFGELRKEQLQEYIQDVKINRKNRKTGNEIGGNNWLKKECNMHATINPKVDSKKQARVQVSFNLRKLSETFPNKVRVNNNCVHNNTKIPRKYYWFKGRKMSEDCKVHIKRLKHILLCGTKRGTFLAHHIKALQKKAMEYL
jgi:hypothetical protein